MEYQRIEGVNYSWIARVPLRPARVYVFEVGEQVSRVSLVNRKSGNVMVSEDGANWDFFEHGGPDYSDNDLARAASFLKIRLGLKSMIRDVSGNMCCTSINKNKKW